MPSVTRRNQSVVLVGAIPHALASSVEALLASHDVVTTRVDAAASVVDAVRTHDPAAVLVWACDPFAVVAVMVLRGAPETADLPVIAISPTASREDFVEAFATGADDLVGVDRVEGVVARVRTAMVAREAPKRSRGRVLVASAIDRWSLVAMTAFDRAGYEVACVREPEHVLRGAMEAKARVVIAGPDLAADASLVERSRESQLAWVLACTAVPSGAAPERVKRIDAAMPAEGLVFAANELLFAFGANQRASVRLPYAATIAFRAAGASHDEIGFCHNISAGGLYVRTLAPLSSGDEAWIEMRAPGDTRVVRIVGNVAWAKRQGRDDASAPLGFGVKLTGGLGADLDRYHAAYESLLRETMCDPASIGANAAISSTAAVGIHR